LRFKYKTSSDYSGDGVKIMLLVYQAGGSAYRTSAKQAKKSFTLEPTEEWVTLNWDITFEGDILRGVKRMLRFDISPGDGKIYFDDIELIGIPED